MARHGQVAKQGISIHAPRTGSDSTTLQKIKTPLTFQSTLPARGATTAQRANHCRFSISIHAPRTGSDTSTGKRSTISLNFNPRSPHGERRYLRAHGGCARNFNPRSPHGERLPTLETIWKRRTFQSTLPARGATRASMANLDLKAFQSTLPARGATAQGYQINPATIFQSTLPARGATRRCSPGADTSDDFNPRSPHGERLGSDRHMFPCPFQFQSTLPARGATRYGWRRGQNQQISIHAPRTGSDNFVTRHSIPKANFNPRSPHGERQKVAADMGLDVSFQSTLPARGATNEWKDALEDLKFQSTLPARGATNQRRAARWREYISIHAPRTGSDEHGA